ncbi:MAG: DNA alkylation repair protein [Alphaproteobacteria bacterium]|nr:DNA alkylation repair protein [Alphaproteobacteria bacterium]
MLDFDEIYKILENNGSEQSRKIYLKHGAKMPMFGVSFKVLGDLRKKIKINHPLAEQLWQSGNTDARILALMVADPAQMTLAKAENWLGDENVFYMHSNYMGGLMAKSDSGMALFEKWSKSDKELFKHCAYDTLSTMLKNGVMIPKERMLKIVQTIIDEIHTSPNRARNGMNMSLIAIGVYGEGMKDVAIQAARKIGKVEVDHGDTSCKTADAESYILKSIAHHDKKKVAKKTAKTA